MSALTADYENVCLSGNLEFDLAFFKKIFKKDSAFRIKKINSTQKNNVSCALVYFDGMVDSTQLNEAVIKPILLVDLPNISGSLSEYFEKQVLFARDTKRTSSISKIIEGILYGEALVLINGSPEALMVDAKGWRTRGINEPDDERVLQGPREGFDEAALLNVSLIRRKLQTPDFCSEVIRVGRRTSTMVFICYLNSLTDQKHLSVLKQKIKNIDIDGILDSNYISEEINTSKFSLFKRTGTTERPDIVAARLLEGRIAVIVDGTPVVLTVPYLFSENFQSDEDYYQNYIVSSFGRMLRYLCFVLSITIPAVFVALSTFHKELFPTSLAITVARLRGGVPFSPLTEAFILILIFEILRETGVRMPQSLGHALSIVGGLVVGEAAVTAGIISTPMLIAVALSGIAGLMIPRLKGAVLYLRIILLIFASFFGLYGIIAVLAVTVIHVISLESFGVDYTSSLSKANLQSLKDTVIRAPWQFMKKRPLFNKNTVRQGEKK